MLTATWDDLKKELEAWQACGQSATLWWRDDDAEKETDALGCLLDHSVEAEVPLALAVIPANVDPALDKVIGAHAGVSVVQHGFSHTNHAPEGVKKAEFGAHRSLDVMSAEIDAGHEVLGRFEDFVPVFVPPWNRMDEALSPHLASRGFRGVSAFGPARSDTAKQPRRINTHVDVIDWRGTCGFVGDDVALGALVGHLSARRQGTAPLNEVTGVLTHHLVHDDGVWAFLRTLSERARAWGARWLSVGEVLRA